MPDWAVIRRRARPWLVLLAIAALLATISGGDSGTASAVDPVRVSPTHSALATAAVRRQARLGRAVRSVLGHSAFVARGGGRKREIALTFDDGPGPYTPGVLAALNRLGVRGTFFVVGRQESAFHTATLAQLGRGHVIANHTENHPHLAALSASDQHAELLAPIQWLASYGVPRPLLFRPPYGSYDDTTIEQLRRLGMLMVLWSVDSRDYERPGVEQIVEHVVSAARPGSIVLLHDGGGDRSQTIAAIPRIVTLLRAKHYRLVTVPELLRNDPPPAGRRPPELAISEG